MDTSATTTEVRLAGSHNDRVTGRALTAKLFEWTCLGATLSCLFALAAMLIGILYNGTANLDWQFLTSLPSGDPAKAGIKISLAGSCLLIVLTTFFSVPVGLATAIYLEEYAGQNWWVRLIRTNIANLAGVPSIVYGILGLGLFVRALALDRSVIAGALTLSLVILPVIIIASQEALRAVPNSLRRASYALGATRWQTIRHQILPMALPGMMTGVILSLSRALGEAAPLVAVGAVNYVAFLPETVYDPFTALPLKIYDWSGRPQKEFRDLAATGIIVLLGLLFCMNAVAVWIRYRFSR